jgi:hypothetical protein
VVWVAVYGERGPVSTLVWVAVYGERGPVSTHQVSDFILFLVTVLLVPKDVSVSDRVVVIGRGGSRHP